MLLIISLSGLGGLNGVVKLGVRARPLARTRKTLNFYTIPGQKGNFAERR
jgi:hypothetical protein